MFAIVHTLQRKYRPVLAKLLSGARNPSEVEALRELPLADLELLLDPLFSKRKITRTVSGFPSGPVRRTGVD